MAGEGLGPLERAEKKRELLDRVQLKIAMAEEATEGRKANAILRILHHLVETISVDLP